VREDRRSEQGVVGFSGGLEGADERGVGVVGLAEVEELDPPVLPASAPGSPFTAVEFEGLTAMPYVDSGRCKGDGKTKCAARLAYSLKATGVRAPSRAMPVRPAPEHNKDAA